VIAVGLRVGYGVWEFIGDGWGIIPGWRMKYD
jgi:hypothetical protein